MSKSFWTPFLHLFFPFLYWLKKVYHLLMWSLVKYIFGYIKHGRLSKLKHFLMHFCIKIWRQLCRKLLDQKSYIWQPELILMVAQSSKLFLCTFVLEKSWICHRNEGHNRYFLLVWQETFSIFFKRKKKKNTPTLYNGDLTFIE